MTTPRLTKASVIVDKMTDAHRCLTQLFGDEYNAKAEPWRRLIRDRMDATGKPIMKSLLDVIKSVLRDDEYDSTIAWLLSAAVDIIEQEPNP